MEDNGLVSIIIVSYNHENFISTCIKSIFYQTYSNWELIVADDASRDNSVKIFNEELNKYGINATKIYNNEKFSATLNKCLKYCKGEFVKIISADDYLHFNFLKDSIKTFSEIGYEYGVIYSNAIVVEDTNLNERKKVLINNPDETHSGYIFNFLVNKNFIPALTVNIRREVILKVGEFDTQNILEDYDYWMRASLITKFYYINSELAYYRIHTQNVSNKITDWTKYYLLIFLKHAIYSKECRKKIEFFAISFYKNDNKELLNKIYQSNVYTFKIILIKLFYEIHFPKGFGYKILWHI
jgi:glycosyltransferase involved in cell wall biosynthesis